MVIEILQAGTGDSIWVSHNKKNIVIDGGNLQQLLGPSIAKCHRMRLLTCLW